MQEVNGRGDRMLTPGQRAPVYGPWATLCLAVLTYVPGALLLAVIFVVAPPLSRSMGWELERGFLFDHRVLDSVRLVSYATVLVLVWWFVRLRRGLPFREYVALRWTPARVLIGWAAAPLALLAAMGAAFIASGAKPPLDVPAARLPEAVGPWLFLFLLNKTVLAPLAEEILFRGFMFEGLRGAKAGDAGAIVLTAVTWGVAHGGFDPFATPLLLGLGVVLGLARRQTNSLVPSLVMHIAVNAVAFAAFVYFQFGRGG